MNSPAPRRLPIEPRRLLVFTGILAAIAVATFLASWLLRLQQADGVGGGVQLIGGTLGLGWMLFGLYTLVEPGRGRQAMPWRYALLHLLITAGGSLLAEFLGSRVATGLGTAVQLLVVLGSGVLAWRIFQAAPQYRSFATISASLLGTGLLVWFLSRHDMPTAAITLGGIAGMAGGFLAGVAGLRAVFFGPGFAAVARTVIDEAIRMRIALVLLLLFVLSLPLLPLLLDASELLEYRVQFLLTWSLGATTVLLGLLTVFLGCGSLCGDIDSTRIHMTLTKPLSRAEYLFGKWLGLVAVNALLVGLAGLGIFCLTNILALSPAQSPADRRAVDEQVLVARQRIGAEHPAGAEFETAVTKMIDQFKEDRPDAFATDESRTRESIRRFLIRKWHTLKPDKMSAFTFSGLQPPDRQRADLLHLEMRPYAEATGYDGGDVRFALWLNDRPFPFRDGKHYEYTLPGGITHTLELPVEAVSDDGVLKVSIQNRNFIMAGSKTPSWIEFQPGKGLVLLETVGGFGPNYLSGLIIIWLKMAMIAAVSVTAGSFLGFPVAVLVGLMIFFTAFGNSVVADSIDIYTGVDNANDSLWEMSDLRLIVFRRFVETGDYWEATKVFFAILGEFFVALIPSFNQFDAISAVATGIQVRLWSVLECLLRVGLIPPLVLGLIAWTFFERRDLVRSNT